ncbi:response regulator receiver domain [Pedobacter sp. GSP4]|uniref:response regulator receiver domain n=1 Tax=Pedobacter sp. GSP4 TaxID=3453716 RepID=UPI003EED69C1
MYSDKAFNILNSSINNAVFIDEKAKDFYSGTALDQGIPEEKLSFQLFDTFKKNGKNLVVHKFEKSNLEEPNTLEYLFKGKDLILLDWELAELAGQEYSLILLAEAIRKPNINFCCVYSSSNNFNQIPLFLDAYFSGLTKENYEQIKNEFSFFETGDLAEVVNKDEGTMLQFIEEHNLDFENFPIENAKGKPATFLLRLVHIALNVDKFIVPDGGVAKHEVLNTGDDSFMINNTFVLTLKKDFDGDSDVNKLLRRISDIMVKNKGSFFQLLGLEMQSVFNSNERFIDETILKSSTEALFKFRNHIKDDKTFGIIIKKLLLEQAYLQLRTAKLKLLDSEFLEHRSKEIADVVTNEDLHQLNVFYNSVSVKGLIPGDVPNLNFGDVFRDAEENYYLCITALCDCYYPNKIDSNFYFAKGKVFEDVETALRLGDTAFLSFLPNSKVVQWGDAELVKKVKIKKLEGESEDQLKTRKLESELNAYRAFLHKPFYIKPKIYNVENYKLIDNKMRIWEIKNKFFKEEFDQKLDYFDVTYVTTLRNDYTQRIANHAFGHPARVGVDFVKI